MQNTLLLNSDASSTDERTIIKGPLLVEKKIKKKIATYLELYTRQSCLTHTHFLQGLVPSILILAFSQYFSGFFPLVFLEGYHSSSSPGITSLYLDPTIRDSSAPSKRVVFFTSTLFQSCQRYANLFFFFFSSASLLFLAFSLILSSTSFLAF